MIQLSGGTSAWGVTSRPGHDIFAIGENATGTEKVAKFWYGSFTGVKGSVFEGIDAEVLDLTDDANIVVGRSKQKINEVHRKK